MKHWKNVILLILLLAAAGCGNRKTNVGLEVDLYLHPEAANPDDLLLQTAIRKRLSEDNRTHQSLIHVRVIDCIVFLSGSVKSDGVKQTADTVARETQVSVNGHASPCTPEVRNLIEVIK